MRVPRQPSSRPRPLGNHMELAGYTANRVAQLVRRRLVVPAIGEQDRVSLRQLRHGVEQPTSEGEPSPHRVPPSDWNWLIA